VKAACLLLLALNIAGSSSLITNLWIGGLNAIPARVRGNPKLAQTQFQLFQSDWESLTQLMQDGCRANNIGRCRWPLSPI
jgi:hypothetical protein